MQDRFRGKRVLVTGAGSGMGREICLRFVAEGAEVEALGRTASRLEETRRAAACPERVRVHVVDLFDAEGRREFCRTFREEGKPLDVLVNNAGSFSAARLEEVGAEDFALMHAVHVTAPFELIQACLPLFRLTGGGSVVNVASTLGYMASPKCSSYGISKAGLLMLTKSVALEYARERIRANSVSPAVVRTSIFESVMPAEKVPAYLESMAARHPLGRVGEVGDVAAAVLFLASDEASWITGVNLPVDGGLSLT